MDGAHNGHWTARKLKGHQFVVGLVKTRLPGEGEGRVSLGVPVIIGAFEGGPVAIGLANFGGHISRSAPVTALGDSWGGSPRENRALPGCPTLNPVQHLTQG